MDFFCRVEVLEVPFFWLVLCLSWQADCLSRGSWDVPLPLAALPGSVPLEQ